MTGATVAAHEIEPYICNIIYTDITNFKYKILGTKN